MSRWEVVLDKLKFWKHDDESFDSSEFGSISNDPMQPDPMSQTPDPLSQTPDPFSQSPDQLNSSMPQQPQMPQQPSYDQTFPQQSFGNPATTQEHHYEEPTHDREMELVLAKLDAIKSEMDSLHQRVRNIEQQTTKQHQRSW